MEVLRQLLIERQKKLNLSDAGFAERLGVSRALWQLTRAGKTPIGLSVMKGIVIEFNDLEEHVLNAIYEYESKTSQREAAQIAS